MKRNSYLTIGLVCLVVGTVLVCPDSASTRMVRGKEKIGLGDRATYLEHLTGELPEELEHLRFSFPWPINMSNPTVCLACFYGEKDLFSEEIIHKGIDIRVEEGTTVRASQGGRVILVDQDIFTGHISVFIYSPDGILWKYDHLSADSLPNKIKDRTLIFSLDTDVTVSEGEKIGKVSEFPYPLPNGKECHHLHVGVYYYPNPNELEDAIRERIIANDFNPLLILERL